MDVDFFIKAGDTLPVILSSLTDADGDAIDLTLATEVSFLMAPEGSSTISASGAAEIVGAAAGGQVQYVWQTADTATPGYYIASFVVAYASGTQTFPSEGFIRVKIGASVSTQPTSPTNAICAVSDVLAVTGRTVTQEDLSIAWSVMEGIIGRPLFELLVSLGADIDIVGIDGPEGVDVLTTRDQYWLKCATAWEAAWVTDNPDTFSSFDVATLSQSGQSATLLSDGLIVAPMARRCLKWVTWMKTRSVKIQRPFPYARLINPTVNDDLGRPWNSL
jgi:hypothetical protein